MMLKKHFEKKEKKMANKFERYLLNTNEIIKASELQSVLRLLFPNEKQFQNKKKVLSKYKLEEFISQNVIGNPLFMKNF